MAGTAEPAGRRFVPEIEGLRAVAAVLVAVYHVFLGRVSGGVDVFFVIAGFLITTSLLARVAGDDRVDAGRYLARLGVRLLPVALVVLVAVAAATALWLPVTQQQATFGEIAASALYVENWALALKAVDYAARDAAKSPVQHFWAMSVQGQFYLAWLVLFAAVRLVAGRRRFRAWLTGALALVFVASLVFSVLLTDRNQPLAYFHTGARAWEFAAGGLVAVLLPRLGDAATRLGPVAGPLRTTGGWLGLALIVSCGVVIRVSSQFPGVAALWPVTGAVLVILAAGPGGRWASGRLLASRPFVYIGGVAYALYLWHWPILVFYRSGPADGRALGLAEGFGIIAVSLALAIATTCLVERPLRARLGMPRHPWAVVRACAAGLAGVALVTLAVATTPAQPALETAPDPVSNPGAAALARRTPAPSGRVPSGALPSEAPVVTPQPVAIEEDESWDEEWWSSSSSSSSEAGPAATIPPTPTSAARGRPVKFVPDLRTAKADLTGLHAAGCQQKVDDPRVVVCSRGDPGGKVTALLVGGSHATHWYPALNRIAKDRGWRLLTAVKAGCRFLSGPFGNDAESRSCAAWNDEVMRIIRYDPPDFIITTSTVTHPRGERTPPGYVDMWRRLDRLGVGVIAIRDTPRASFDRVDCLARHPSNPDACDIARSPTMDTVDPARLRSDVPGNVLLVDVTDYLCTADRCPAVVGNVVVYRDRHHLTATYAITLVPMLAEQIPARPFETRTSAAGAP